VDSKVTKYLDGLSFAVSRSYTYDVPDYATPFLEAQGNEKENSHDIAFIGENQGRTYAMLGFDIHNSDFPLYMEFPLLMYNLVNECVQGGMVTNYVYNSGDSVSVNTNVDGELPVVTKPDGDEVTLSDYRFNFNDTKEMGIYSITQTLREEDNTEVFAVNFPVSESKIDTHPSMISSGDDKVVTEVKGIFNLRNFIILLSLILLALEWIFSLRK
jgi:hypothetical protein